MSNKLKGLPTVYYLNLDKALERREWMETQFDRWEIKNFKRFSGSNMTSENFDDWKNLLFKPELYKKKSYRKIAVTISTLEMIRYWLENTNEKYLILFEDDYDLNLIEYWHFDWEYLMNNIPYDWDCIQLGFESNHYLSFFLHPKTYHSYYGPILINRHFAEKLLKINSIDGKYFLLRKYGKSPDSTRYKCLSIDHFLVNNGKSYQIPLITQKPFPDEWPKYHHIVSRDYYYWWWMTQRDQYSLEDFFTYGKKNDFDMTYRVPQQIRNALDEKQL
jgi:hypothetical protein